MKKLKVIYNDNPDTFFEHLVNDFIKDKEVTDLQCQIVKKDGAAYPIAFIVYEVQE